MDPAEALRAAHPGRFDVASSQAWVDARRAVLTARSLPAQEAQTASSSCAASGAQAHARAVAEGAAAALARLDAGLGPHCRACGSTLPFERLDSMPAAVACTACA